MSETTELKQGHSLSKGFKVYVMNNTMFRVADKNAQPSTADASKPATTHTTVKPPDDIWAEITPWGNNNLFPQTILEEIRDSYVGRMLQWEADALYGGGLAVGKIEGYKDDGTEIFKPYKFKEWEEFNRRSPMVNYLMTSIQDYYHFGVPFPELRTTIGSSLTPKRIYSIKAQKAKNCRFGKMNNTGTIPDCHLGIWNDSDKAQAKVPLLNPFDDPETALRNSDADKVIFPLSYPTPGEDIYPLLPWTSIRKYWLPISKIIPEIKYNIMKVGTHILLVVEIADWFWEEAYPDWAEKPELQEKRREDNFKKFNEFVTGSANAGKMMFVPGKSNPETYESFPGWKITPVDKGIGDGKWLDDTTECSLQLMAAIGIDPSLFGIVPGKAMSTNGGSDKRVSYNIYISMRQFDRDMMLLPLYFIKNFNAWSEDMEFRFKYPLITTLDKGKESQQQSS